MKLIMSYCCPGRHFGGNQLLDGSMSLSPLFPSQTIDLHVRTATSLHQSFLWLHFAQEKITIFRVQRNTLTFSPPFGRRSILHLLLGSYLSRFRFAYWFYTKILAYVVDSLVRVSRRVKLYSRNVNVHRKLL